MKLKTFTVLFLVQVAHSAFGFSDFVPLRERAQAHSLTGALQSNESIYSNPAASAFTQEYTLEGTFAFPKSFSASILDTRTNQIGGGLAYFKEQDSSSESYRHGVRLSLSTRVSESVAVAIAGKAIWEKSGNDSANFKDLDAGVIWNAGFASAGLVLRNFSGGDEQSGREREVSLGGRIGYSQTMFLSAAAHSKLAQLSSLSGLAPYEYGIGVEYVSPWYFSLMGGYRFKTDSSSLDPSCWSMGVSFLSPKLSLHYALELPEALDSESNHLLGLSMAF